MQSILCSPALVSFSTDGTLKPTGKATSIEAGQRTNNIKAPMTLYAQWEVSVTGMVGVPVNATAGTPLALAGTELPTNATHRNITWSIVSARTLGATISKTTLNTTSAGEVVVRTNITKR